jgi:hypothetical protein
VGDAFGAEVINTKGNCAGIGAVPQEASKIDRRKISLRADEFIRGV